MANRTVALSILLLLVSCGAEQGDSSLREATEAVSQCPTQTAEGVDVSDHNGTIDWAAVKKSGRAFAFMKATQGTYNTQATFSRNWNGSKSSGVLRSPYHFFDPREDGVMQADKFLGVVGLVEAGDLAPMLDLECPDGDANCLYTGEPGIVAGALVVARALAWLETVEQRTGRKPIIYSYPAWFGSLGTDTSKLAAYPLFIATLSNCASVPSPWTKAAFWQYSWTGTVPGIPGEVDVDRFMGSTADLVGFADGGLSTSRSADGATADSNRIDGDPDGLAMTGDESASPASPFDASYAGAMSVSLGAEGETRVDAAASEPALNAAVDGGCACNLSSPRGLRLPWWLVAAMIAPLGRGRCPRDRAPGLLRRRTPERLLRPPGGTHANGASFFVIEIDDFSITKRGPDLQQMSRGDSS
jgi:GH25 family lysozyme M1 (1,4-beta-N-acetylmuramidase)